MITLNTDFTFTEVKLGNTETVTEKNDSLAEVSEMTAQDAVEKSRTLSNPKRENKHDKELRRLDDLLLDAVDETLRQVFREEGVKVIFHYFENKCHLKRSEIAKKPEYFCACLQRMLSSAGPMVEKMILKNLYSKLGLKFEEEKKGYKFSDYIKELREKVGLLDE